MQNNRKELHNLSNQMVELFIKDVFSKNKVSLDEAKAKISDEQRVELRNTFNQLKEQVETFLHEKNAAKTVTEEDEEQNKNTESPLRETFLKRKTENS